jgi:hypothetical protein
MATLVRIPARWRARLVLAVRRRRRRWHFAAGFLVAAVALVAVGEIGVRVAPPRTVQPYLPDDDRSGPFRSDPHYGVQYRSWDAFQHDYADVLKTHEFLFTASDPPKTWAMFGSSFVHAPGMLADTAREQVPNRHVFNLGRNEFLYVRAAQVEFLLDHGLRPERIIFALHPLDAAVFAHQTVRMVHAGPNGVLAFDPRLPAVGGEVIRKSRLALAGWVRADLQYAVPFHKPSELTDRVQPVIRSELAALFRHMGEATARHEVPVTVLLLPNYEQITRGAGFAFQDEAATLATDAGLDVCDVRDAFRNYPDQPALFVPDKHFSTVGNHLLLTELVKHFHDRGAAMDVAVPEGGRE